MKVLHLIIKPNTLQTRFKKSIGFSPPISWLFYKYESSCPAAIHSNQNLFAKMLLYFYNKSHTKQCRLVLMATKYQNIALNRLQLASQYNTIRKKDNAVAAHHRIRKWVKTIGLLTVCFSACFVRASGRLSWFNAYVRFFSQQQPIKVIGCCFITAEYKWYKGSSVEV